MAAKVVKFHEDARHGIMRMSCGWRSTTVEPSPSRTSFRQRETISASGAQSVSVSTSPLTGAAGMVPASSIAERRRACSEGEGIVRVTNQEGTVIAEFRGHARTVPGRLVEEGEGAG